MASIDKRILKTISQRLTEWWTDSFDGENLFPWRSPNISPYQALITEVLLQRTRAEAVNKIYNEFFERFPGPDVLCSATETEIKNAINSLGLSWRAKKLRELGCAIANGIPDKLDALLKLPNVGVYAAGAYLSLHRGKRAIIPDANMARVLGRILGFKVHPETRRDKSFLELCEQITPRKKFREFNYSILDFGRTICKPAKPLCNTCFLNDICKYSKNVTVKKGKKL